MKDQLCRAHEEWENAFVGKVIPLQKQADACSDIGEYLRLREKAERLDNKITEKLFKFHDRYVRTL